MESPVAAKNVSNVSSFMGREDAPLSPMLGSEDMALALAATGRSIPVWPRARRARHRPHFFLGVDAPRPVPPAAALEQTL